MEEGFDFEIWLALSCWRAAYIAWIDEDLELFNRVKTILVILGPDICDKTFDLFIKHSSPKLVKIGVELDEIYNIMNDIKECICIWDKKE